NPGHEYGYQPFEAAQIDAVIALCQQLKQTYHIRAHQFVGHSDIAPLRKEDPGELFPWAILAKHGIGLWHELTFNIFTTTPLLFPYSQNKAVETLQEKLHLFGYAIPRNGLFDESTEAVVMAFKRHFCPETLGKYWDSWADSVLNDLIKKRPSTNEH
ncbi:MAG: N-acetylmuramoyl-L-alanine amidase, partial [Burkholderiales bacterium]